MTNAELAILSLVAEQPRHGYEIQQVIEHVGVPAMSLPALDLVPTSSGMYASDGSPLLPTYLVYFGGLFLILRWWKQADPLRKTRLSVWATAACVLWAWVLNMFWQFPQPWGFMLAATMSIAVQLSAPWLGDRERAPLHERYRQA